jgi:hypothetical protein
MISIQIAGNVQINDISSLQFAIIGNAMTDNFIDGRTTGFWKAMIIEGRWIGTPFQRFFMDHGINLVRRDAQFHQLSSEIQHFSCTTTSVSHFDDFFGRLDFNDPWKQLALVLFWLIIERQHEQRDYSE